MNLENKNKTMPFVENEGYVEHLIERATENALRRSQPQRRRIPFARIAASVAVVASLGYSAWAYVSYREAQAAPLDTFLSNISDDEAEMLNCYYDESLTMEDISF